MTSYRSLRLSLLPAHARVGEPEAAQSPRLALEQPAPLAMPDLRRVAAVAIHPDATLEAAQQRMVHARAGYASLRRTLAAPRTGSPRDFRRARARAASMAGMCPFMSRCNMDSPFAMYGYNPRRALVLQ